MTHQRKNEIFKELFDSCLELQYGKAKDYATDSDALSNFKSQDANALGITPYQKWGVYFGKQAMSILGAIGKNPNCPSTTSEPIEERINDAIIYLVLLKCLLEDSESIPKDFDAVISKFELEELQKKSISIRDNNNIKVKTDKLRIEKDSETETFRVTFQDKNVNLKMTNILAYSESNPYVILEFKPVRIINDKVGEYIMVSERKWENDQWITFISIKEPDFNETWFLYNKALKK